MCGGGMKRSRVHTILSRLVRLVLPLEKSSGARANSPRYGSGCNSSASFFSACSRTMASARGSEMFLISADARLESFRRVFLRPYALHWRDRCLRPSGSRATRRTTIDPPVSLKLCSDLNRLFPPNIPRDGPVERVDEVSLVQRFDVESAWRRKRDAESR